MSRDTTQLHPRLRAKLDGLQYLCSKQGLKIGISECMRTVKEQDDLYAQGRTKPGKVVTNAQGKTYSSMHQWGTAFDFYRNDGKGAFNTSGGFFSEVGKIGQSIGLEWGGTWTSPVDLPHFQLKEWGSTTKRLKAKYKNPETFKRTWKNVKGMYTTSKKTTMRGYAGTGYGKIKELPKGVMVKALGPYDKSKTGFMWYLVRYTEGKYTFEGYVLKSALKG